MSAESQHPVFELTGAAMVLHPYVKRGGPLLRAPEAHMAEAVGLTIAIGMDVRRVEAVPMKKFRPSSLLGQGKLDEYSDFVRLAKIELAVIDATLTPAQQRNLENTLHCKVIDRTGLILEIFAQRALTREGVLQVELAQLSYQRSRLVRAWTHLERQRGGISTVGGPGERQIEADRRAIDDRITLIRRQLDAVTRTRELHRKRRRDAPYPVVALVGYTNAGKSTLFNGLTEADVMVRDQLFATLDPTMRGVTLPNGKRIILSDTVGFISELPTQLVAAFRATLEEVLEADILIHVRDVSHPDSKAQKCDVLDVLTDLGVGGEKRDAMIEVLNKSDCLNGDAEDQALNYTERNNLAVLASARIGTGVSKILTTVEEQLNGRRVEVDLFVSAADGAALAWLYQHGQVMARRECEDGREVALTVSLEPEDLGRFEKRFEAAITIQKIRLDYSQPIPLRS